MEIILILEKRYKGWFGVKRTKMPGFLKISHGIQVLYPTQTSFKTILTTLNSGSFPLPFNYLSLLTETEKPQNERDTSLSENNETIVFFYRKTSR